MGRPEDTLDPYHGEPPPSYAESTGQVPGPSSSFRNPPNGEPSRVPQQEIPRQFPSAFNFYLQGMTSRSFIIGEHQNQPRYVISLHSAFSQMAPIVLHSGPDESLPPIATVEWQVFGPSFDVSLPPPPGSRAQAAEEKVDWTSRHYGFGVGCYQFAIEIGGTGVREAFEWRHSTGDAVTSLGGHYSGWKLVRLSRGAPGRQGNLDFVGGGHLDSDGNEVVAAFTAATGSLTKVAKFQFMGTGDTGMLGERWAILSVISAFALFVRERNRRNRR